MSGEGFNLGAGSSVLFDGSLNPQNTALFAVHATSGGAAVPKS